MDSSTEGTDQLTEQMFQEAIAKLRENNAHNVAEPVYFPFPTLSDDEVERRLARIKQQAAQGFAEQQMAQFHRLWQNELLRALQKSPRPFEPDAGDTPPPPPPPLPPRPHRPLLSRVWDWALDQWPLMWKKTYGKEIADWTSS